MKTTIAALLFGTLFQCFMHGQQIDTIFDIDGNIYQTISIGNQIWMKENLKTTTYNDSIPIAYVENSTEWCGLTTGAYTWFENDEKVNREIYGALYNWYAVDTRKLCPIGWHVPTDSEWNQLEFFFGVNPADANTISYRMGETGKLKAAGTVQDSTGLWHTPNEGGTDESGFTALPGGFVYFNDGMAYGLGSYGFWWSSSPHFGDRAWYRLLYYHSAFMSRNHYSKKYGFSVRCLKD